MGRDDAGALTVEDQFFLRIAVKNGLLDAGEAERAGAEARARGMRVQELLQRSGRLSLRDGERLREAMAASQVVRLDAIYAEMLLAEQRVPPTLVQAAFEEQRRQRYRVRLGSILVARGLITPAVHRALISRVIAHLSTHGQAAYSSQVLLPPAMSSRGPQLQDTASDERTAAARSGRSLSRPLGPPQPTPPPPRGWESETGEGLVGPRGLISREVPASASDEQSFSIPLDETGEVSPRAQLLHDSSLLLDTLDRIERDLASSVSEDRHAQQLMVSALKIGLSSGEGSIPLHSADRALLESALVEDDTAWRKASDLLDRVGEESGEEFQPERYLERKRQRLRLLLGASVLCIGVLMTVIALLGSRLVSRQATLREAQELVAQADAVGPEEQLILCARAEALLAELGGEGPEQEELRGRIAWTRVQAEARQLLNGGRPGEARALLAGTDPALDPDAHARLLREAERGELLARGRAAAEAGETRAAVLAFRRAQALGDPGGVAQARLDEVREALRRRFVETYQQAYASLSLGDEERYVQTGKQLVELFNEDLRAEEGQRELSFRRTLEQGKNALTADRIDEALARFDAARRLRPDDPELRSWAQRALARQDVLREERAARAAEAEGRLDEAIAHYRRALEQAQPPARAALERELTRCREALSRRQETVERRDRLREALDLLRTSRIAEAQTILDELLSEGTDAGARRLQAFAARLEGTCFVPPGPFRMGSGEGRPEEQPEHERVLTGYFIDRTEVSNEAYARAVAEGVVPAPSHWTTPVRQEGGRVEQSFAPVLAKHPVVNVSWAEARAYAAWRGGTLPSEAQWEKAARGPDGRSFPWGEDEPVRAHVDVAPTRLRTHRTAQAGAHGDDRSPYGVLDMAGNVSEWTASALVPYPGAPAGLRLKEGRRVLRGGSYRYPYADARCARRDSAREDYRSPMVGFRVLIEVPADLPALHGER